jgi:hypothetical protein
MRDIRADLQDRAEGLEREIKGAEARFDELIERLKQEHDGKVKDLKSEFDAVELLIGLEHRRLGNGAAQAKSQAQPQPAASQSQAQPPRSSQPEMALRRAV